MLLDSPSQNRAASESISTTWSELVAKVSSLVDVALRLSMTSRLASGLRSHRLVSCRDFFERCKILPALK